MTDLEKDVLSIKPGLTAPDLFWHLNGEITKKIRYFLAGSLSLQDFCTE